MQSIEYRTVLEQIGYIDTSIQLLLLLSLDPTYRSGFEMLMEYPTKALDFPVTGFFEQVRQGLYVQLGKNGVLSASERDAALRAGQRDSLIQDNWLVASPLEEEVTGQKRGKPALFQTPELTDPEGNYVSIFAADDIDWIAQQINFDGVDNLGTELTDPTPATQANSGIEFIRMVDQAVLSQVVFNSSLVMGAIHYLQNIKPANYEKLVRHQGFSPIRDYSHYAFEMTSNWDLQLKPGVMHGYILWLNRITATVLEMCEQIVIDIRNKEPVSIPPELQLHTGKDSGRLFSQVLKAGHFYAAVAALRPKLDVNLYKM